MDTGSWVNSHIDTNWKRYTRDPDLIGKDMGAVFSPLLADGYANLLEEPVLESDFDKFKKRYVVPWLHAFENLKDQEVDTC